MGELEKKSRKREVQRLILGTIAAVGVLSVAVLAPNVIGAAAKLGLMPNTRDSEIIKRSTARLRKRGLIWMKDGHYVLTEAGEKILRKWQFTDFKLKKNRRWDQKWRIVIFDIPEKLKKVREQVRIMLVSAGFARLQDSVWVYPYDCEDIITLLKIDFGIRKYMLYLIVEELEDDKHLREEFGLA